MNTEQHLTSMLSHLCAALERHEHMRFMEHRVDGLAEWWRTYQARECVPGGTELVQSGTDDEHACR